MDRETKMLRAVRHERIVEFVGFTTLSCPDRGSHLLIFMELMPGVSRISLRKSKCGNGTCDQLACIGFAVCWGQAMSMQWQPVCLHSSLHNILP